MDVIPFGDELQQFPRALHTLDPSWLRHDLFVGAPQGDHWLFFRFLAAVMWIAGPIGGAIAARLLIWSLGAVSLVVLARSLGLRPLATILGVLLFVAIQGFVLAGESLVGEAIARHIAYPIVFLSIAFWIQGRFGRVAMMLGVATSFHFLVGAWATLVMLAVLPIELRVKGRRLGVVASCGVLFLLCSAPGWIPILPLILEARGTDSALADQIFVYFRHPHHLDPASWPIGDYVLLAGNCVLVACLCVVKSLREYTWMIRKYVFAAIAITVAALIMGLTIPSTSFLKLHPFRFGPPMLALLTSLLTAQWIVLHSRSMVRAAGAAGILAAVAFFAPRGSFHVWQDARRLANNEKSSRIDVLRWIRTRSPGDATVLANPAWSDVAWMARRAATSSFKLVPFEASRILEWKRRLDIISGEPHVSRPGHEMMADLGAAYDRLTGPELVARGAETGATVAIGCAPCDHETRPVYENAHYCVYPVGDFSPINQNFLILRYDDYAPISPYAGPPRQIETERELFKKIAWHGGVVSVGVIPFPVSANASTDTRENRASSGESWLSDADNPWTVLLREFVQLGIVEPALHGFEHRKRSMPGYRPGEFRRQSESWQRETIGLGLKTLSTAMGRPIEVFIPPWNSWDDGTVSALKANGFQWLSPDMHHAEFESVVIRTAGQSTFSPAAALVAMKNASTEPDGSVLVLVMHPFDLENAEQAENYKNDLESLVAFAKASPHWQSVGFSGLPRDSDAYWAARYSAAVQWEGLQGTLDDSLGQTPVDSVSLFRPYDWYQDNLWRARLPVVILFGAAFAICALAGALFVKASFVPSAIGIVSSLAAILVTAVLINGAVNIHDHDFAIRGLRWLSIAAALGASVGMGAAVLKRRTRLAFGSRNHDQLLEVRA